jgi:DNA-binding SARP family transcriptional activator/tetratricopeptide (TPR) repeat protein
MEFRALGPVELWSAGQQRDLGSARARAILAMLLLTPGTIVPADALIDRLWDTRPPPKARESLSAYIARLRASLRDAQGAGVQLLGRARGYVLDIDPDIIDLHQFRRLRRQANALAASGDCAPAARLLREADGLWRGPALAGIPGDWVARMRDGLEEERRAAIVERVDCELELGRHADLVGELSQLMAQYPLDETFVARQMTALYGSGRPAAALSLYRETRSRLIDEQGTEPGPVLTDLHQRILGLDPQLAARPPEQRPADGARPDTLPPELPDFVGRARELELLTSDRGAGPRVTVIEGMPGVGKTALAVQAARRAAGQYPDGTLFLSLRSHQHGCEPVDPAQALDRLLAMLSVPAARIPGSIGERVALWRAQLSRRRMIVILDDAARPDQIRPLLPAAGQCLILITTRRRLSDVADARTLTLDVLPAEDAATLFRRIAGQDAVSDEAQVARAVQLCGNLPLAIQLTASRVARDRPAGLGGLIEELSQAPARLGGSGAASPEVTAAFDLSYRALEPDHQRLFRELGVGPCEYVSLQAAAALDGCTLAEAEKALATLLDHHLLARAPDGQFRLHDLIRGYAAECAARDDPPAQQRQAVSRLLDYYLHTADQADRVLHPFRRRMPVQVTHVPAAGPALGTSEDAAAWLRTEWRNILRAARHAGDHEWKRKCADLTHVLADFIQIQAHWDEAITAHTVALQAARDLADPARTAQAALELSAVRQQAGAHEPALALAEEAAAIYRSLADQAGEAEALDQAGLAHFRAARSREALAYFDEAQALYRAAASQRGIADTLSHSGIASWHLGRCAEATAHLRDALTLYRGIGDRRGEAKMLCNLGKIYLYCGYHRDALDAYQDSLRIFREIGGTYNEAVLYHAIGAVHNYKGSYEECLAAYRRALAIYRDIGDLYDEAEVLNDIGAVYQSASRYDEALVYHERAQLIAEEIGNSSQRLIAMRRIADIRRGSGQYGDAFDHYQSALRLAREIGDPYEEGKILEGIAESTASTQRPSAARIFFRQALDIFERLGVPEAESARIRIETLDPAFSRS